MENAHHPQAFAAARFIKEIGRGKKGARSLTRDDAYQLYAAMLDGRVSDLELGGILLATVLNNSGGTWDNAKKFIELGHLRGDDDGVLGKGTDAHAAAVVGDTVGDPFKDTAGPSLHVLIKLLSTITLVLAPLFIV